MTEKENIAKKLTISLETLVLLVILFVTTFLPADLFSPIIVLVGFFLLFLTLGKVEVSYLKIIAPLLGILFAGIVGIVGHESRHVFRDISYALTPISLLLAGFWIAGNKNIWPGIIKILILGGIIIACLHISKFILHPKILSYEIAQIRYKAQNPNVSLVGLSLVLGLFQNRIKKGNLFPKYFPSFIALPILFLSFILSFSRTSLVLAIVLSISILGWIGKINLKTALTIAVLFCSFILVVLTTPKNDIRTFRGKLARSLTEITISNYKDFKEINNNWRGYETNRAMIAFKLGNIKQKILGQGFGSLIDLGITMPLGGVNFRAIPILHNGYAYILVKTGIFGIFCYVFFYFRLLRISLHSRNSINIEQVVLSRLLLGVTFCLLLSMYVVGGMAEIHNSEYVLLVGFILRRMEQL